LDSRFREVGKLVRRETERFIVGYRFDLRRNTLNPEYADNPDAGREHHFRAYRLKGAPADEVVLRPASRSDQPPEEDEDAE
jgi:hypothetical protein